MANVLVIFDGNIWHLASRLTSNDDTVLSDKVNDAFGTLDASAHWVCALAYPVHTCRRRCCCCRRRRRNVGQRTTNECVLRVW